MSKYISQLIKSSGGRFYKGHGDSVWEVCVGLEIHAQISALSKLFSGAAAGSEATQSAPNASVAFFDVALPGTMPRPNLAVISQSVKTSISLRANVHGYSHFERKHYFYPDSPASYQITQLTHPISTNGFLIYDVPLRSKAGKRLRDTRKGVTRLDRIQMEQDTGRSVHTLLRDRTLLDFNRAGAALVEIVAQPDIRSADEASAFVRGLQGHLRHVGTSEALLEEGGLRADVNVSTRRISDAELEFLLKEYTSRTEPFDGTPVFDSRDIVNALRGSYQVEIHSSGSEFNSPNPFRSTYASSTSWNWTYEDPSAAESIFRSGRYFHGSPLPQLGPQELVLPSELGFGDRVELKNLNSIRAIQRAVLHEAQRQVDLQSEGGKVERETRLFDVTSNESVKLRGKDDQMDYRFMKEPDLAPILLSYEFFDKVSRSVPVLPENLIFRYVDDFGLSLYDSTVIVQQKGAGAFYEATLKHAAKSLGKSDILSLLAHLPNTDAETTASSPNDKIKLSENSLNLCKVVANWIANDLFGKLNALGIPFDKSSINSKSVPQNISTLLKLPAFSINSPALLEPEVLAELIVAIVNGVLSGKTAKDVFSILLQDSWKKRKVIDQAWILFLDDLQAVVDVESAQTVSSISALEQMFANAKSTAASRLQEDVVSDIPITYVNDDGEIITLTPVQVNDQFFQPSPDQLEKIQALSESSSLSPMNIIQALEWRQINDADIIQTWVNTVVHDPALQDSVDKWKKGQDRVLGAFVSRVLELSQGKANPEIASTLVQTALGPLGKKEKHIGRKERARLEQERLEKLQESSEMK